MELRKCLSLLVLVLLTLLTLHSSSVEACMCVPDHPQSHYCKADYVAVIRVFRRSHRLVPDSVVYKVQVKKTYKMNQAGHKMLKHGRVITADNEAMCGVQLDIGKLYMIAGVGNHLNVCSYVKEYQKMTVVERRGFAGLYRKGCNCQVKPCYGNYCLKKHESSDSCIWSPFAKCETDFSFCVPSTHRTPEGNITKCNWRRTPAYKACMADP